MRPTVPISAPSCVQQCTHLCHPAVPPTCAQQLPISAAQQCCQSVPSSCPSQCLAVPSVSAQQ
ncbi:unnamed protein product [Staurois parvus]|uniref:Uncharacterized protein n=1 Tax=Staurois parvus TaxID=386267 RepID=A0ABN9FIA6_9NEOB|nr:unnamed protein product [Staurois parvus]